LSNTFVADCYTLELLKGEKKEGRGEGRERGRKGRERGRKIYRGKKGERKEVKEEVKEERRNRRDGEGRKQASDWRDDPTKQTTNKQTIVE